MTGDTMENNAELPSDHVSDLQRERDQLLQETEPLPPEWIDYDHYTGMIVIHGIGDIQRNQTVKQAVRAVKRWFVRVADFAERADGPGRISIDYHLVDDKGPEAAVSRVTEAAVSFATMELEAPDAAPHDESAT